MRIVGIITVVAKNKIVIFWDFILLESIVGRLLDVRFL